MNNPPLVHYGRVPKVSPNEQPLPDNLEGLLPTEDTFVYPKPASDGKVISESQYNNLLKIPSTRTMMTRQQPSTFQQDQLLLTQKGALGDQLPKRQLSLLNNSTDGAFDDSGLDNFGYITNKQKGISWSRESSTLSVAMSNSLVDDKNGPNNMRRKPTKEMAPESKTENKFYKEEGEKLSGDFTDFATEMVDKRGTGVVFKRREPRSSNKKQSKSSTGSLEFCDFSDGEQDSTV